MRLDFLAFILSVHLGWGMAYSPVHSHKHETITTHSQNVEADDEVNIDITTSVEYNNNDPYLCHFKIVTSEGDMVVALYEETILHLENFVELVEEGFYKDNVFHRVIPGFMIQAGGTKKSKYLARPEIPAEIDNRFIHHRGALAAARMPDDINPSKSSSGTQFYIVHGRPLNEDVVLNYGSEKLIDYTTDQMSQYVESGGAPQLDGEYTVFGYLVSGFEVLDRIAKVATDAKDRPIHDVKIIEIVEIN